MLADGFYCSPQTICTILHEAGKHQLSIFNLDQQMLFRQSMEHSLRNKKFKNLNEMSTVSTEFFDSKPCDFYRRGILMLPDKWLDVIDAGGDYFDY
jgi:hypothetical protein